MNENIKMSVSSLIKQKENEDTIYITFTDNEKQAEISFPSYKIISNNNFSEKEISALKFYIDANKETITKMAKQINPLKAFLS